MTDTKQRLSIEGQIAWQRLNPALTQFAKDNADFRELLEGERAKGRENFRRVRAGLTRLTAYGDTNMMALMFEAACYPARADYPTGLEQELARLTADSLEPPLTTEENEHLQELRELERQRGSESAALRGEEIFDESPSPHVRTVALLTQMSIIHGPPEDGRLRIPGVDDGDDHKETPENPSEKEN
jgi:hypothetical protein